MEIAKIESVTFLCGFWIHNFFLLFRNWKCRRVFRNKWCWKCVEWQMVKWRKSWRKKTRHAHMHARHRALDRRFRQIDGCYKIHRLWLAAVRRNDTENILLAHFTLRVPLSCMAFFPFFFFSLYHVWARFSWAHLSVRCRWNEQKKSVSLHMKNNTRLNMRTSNSTICA